MAELKYTYALDKNEKCVGIENAQKGIEYRCPHCKGEMVVKEGDTVLYGKYAGTELEYDGKKYLVMRQSDILAILG